MHCQSNDHLCVTGTCLIKGGHVMHWRAVGHACTIHPLKCFLTVFFFHVMICISLVGFSSYGILNIAWPLFTPFPIFDWQTNMAGKRAALKAIDWLAFAERVPPNQRAMFNNLKTRSDAIGAKYVANPELTFRPCSWLALQSQPIEVKLSLALMSMGKWVKHF